MPEPYVGFVYLSKCTNGSDHVPKRGKYKGRDCIYCGNCQRFFSYVAFTEGKATAKSVDVEEFLTQGELL